MPTTTRTIRVFISSTFSDLKAERNALQERVFPRLKRYCQRQGWSFQAIDLRWGISNEAALDQSTMRICRAEIARCQVVTPRPNFVVLLGDRHGWRPLPDEIPAAEFHALRPHLPVALADRWYRLDENAVCPLPDGTELDKGRYILQPRTGEFADYDKWFDEVEGPLGEALRRAARELGLPEDARRKYEASATAQEIHDGAFAVPDAREHVLAFIREMRTADGRPLREALPGDAPLKHFVDLKRGKLDEESQAHFDTLKRKLRHALGAERVKTYVARWEGNGPSTEHVHRMSMDVLRSLARLIYAQIKSHSALPLLEEERLRHLEFAQRRARDFTGRAGPLDEIERYLALTLEPVAPLVVHGASGSGKSALLGKAILEKQKDEGRMQKERVIFRFIGATANSTEPRSLLDGLCRELGERYGADNTNLPLDLNKLTMVFRQRLELASAEHPLTLFLDAMDQLQVSDRPELSWLPDKLPAHVRLVVSAIPGPMLDALTSHMPSARFLELGPMRAEDAAELLQKWLQREGRRLAREGQRQAIRDAFTSCLNETLQIESQYGPPPYPAMWGTNESPDHVSCVRFAPGGAYCAIVHLAGGLVLIRTRNRLSLPLDLPFPDSITSCAWSPDGRCLVLGFRDGDVQVRSAETGRVVRLLGRHASLVCSCAWSASGQLVATASFDCSVKIWSIAKREAKPIHISHNARVNDCAFTPDDRYLIAAGGWGAKTPDLRGRDISLSEVASGKSLLRLPLPAPAVAVAILRPKLELTAAYGNNVLRVSARHLVHWPAFHTAIRWPHAGGASMTCLYCGGQGTLSNEVFRAIAEHTPGDAADLNPCLELPVETWDEPRLFSSCSRCAHPVRFNPFFLDGPGVDMQPQGDGS